MHIKDLANVGLGIFPCWLRFNQAKGKWEKGPITPEIPGRYREDGSPVRESWQDTARRPLNDPTVSWAAMALIGVVVPENVVIVDLDTYRGLSEAEASEILGGPMPWHHAKIQNTVGGGTHYAFKMPAWAVRQGSNIGAVGLDTRVAGKGFICTGDGYPQCGFGVLRLGVPDSLPVLPEFCRPLLEDCAPDPSPRAEYSNTATDTATLRDALRFIDPSERDTWFAVGCGIKTLDLEDGFELWDAWSAGEFWHGGCPDSYVAETQEFQWSTMKVDRNGKQINAGTVFYLAMQGGWAPPKTFDAAAAFGANAAPPEVFERLVTRIRESGADVTQVSNIVTEIHQASCNPLQRALLLASLKQELKDAGLYDKSIGKLLESTPTTSAQPAADENPLTYGNNDTNNAALFLSRYYADDRLIRCEGEFYAYTGKAWRQLPTDELKHQIATDMAASRMQASKVNSCIDLVGKLVAVRDGEMGNLPSHMIIFNNGIVDLDSGYLHAHSQSYLSTNILPFDYNPHATCLAWIRFLESIFNGDYERIALLQEWFGYLLTADYTHHKILLLIGPPRSGKGTIGRVLQQLVGGENFSGGSLSAFAEDFFMDMIRLKTVVFIGDAERNVSRNSVNKVIERLKTISGNDAVPYNRKFLRGLSGMIRARVTIAANSVPNLFDDSGALAGRLLPLPLARSYIDAEDHTLLDRLLVELPGIAMWAIQGWYRLREHGRFTIPQASWEEICYISESFSPLLRFIREVCHVGPDERVSGKALYQTYRAWAINEGEEILRPKTFTASVKDATRGKGVVYGTHRFDNQPERGFLGLSAQTVATKAFGVVK